MDYGQSDSSGTDDDLPPAYHNRGVRGGQINGNGRAVAIGGLPYSTVPNNMETQIHLLEQEAYSYVLRAFRAQSDALSWEKASLITELRKELRVSDDEHRELLSRVNTDDTVRRIREWREAGGDQSGALNNVYTAQDQLHSPSVSASRKKQKTGQPVAFSTPMQPLSISAKPEVSTGGARGKKSKSGRALSASEPTKALPIDPMVGRNVLLRWPEDNNFYEAVITDYNPAEGLHALVYDINTSNETWEWVNLSEIPPEDIRLGGEYPGFLLRAGRGASIHGMKKVRGRGGGMASAGRGRGGVKNGTRNDFTPAPPMEVFSDEIKILSTESLIKEVERVFRSNSSDPYAIEKAKQTLKDHERSLMDIIARLADASDGESDEEKHKGGEYRDGQDRDHEDEDEMIEI